MNLFNRSGIHNGFTLIELLAAISIFSILSVLMYGGINTIIEDREIVSDRIKLIDQLRRAVRIMNDDFSQLQPRDVRGVLGRDKEFALSASSANNYIVRLSRAGWKNPLNRNARGIIQRAQYRIDEGSLYREYWQITDKVLGEEPKSKILLNGVDSIEIEYLDSDDNWQSSWPPNTVADMPTYILPFAVRYKISIKNIGEIQRLVELAR